MTRHRPTRVLAALAWLPCLAACGDDPAAAPGEHSWVQRVDAPGAALFSVHGTDHDDVWAVGADAGDGPLIVHFDGERWRQHDSGDRGDLWWVHASDAGPVYFGGGAGRVLRHADGEIEPLSTPAGEGRTVYGVWSAGPGDVYAAGAGERGRGGFLWHDDGDGFRQVELPEDVRGDAETVPGLFKVWGTSPADVWAVGADGWVLRGNARDGFARVPSGTRATLFTVYAADEKVVMVGGDAGGVLLELEGGRLVDRTPEAAPLLQGVTVDPDGVVWVVGLGGSIYRGEEGAYEGIDPGLDVPAAQVLHAAWADPRGHLWSAGGNVLSEALDAGLLLYRGPPAASEVWAVP